MIIQTSVTKKKKSQREKSIPFEMCIKHFQGQQCHLKPIVYGWNESLDCQIFFSKYIYKVLWVDSQMKTNIIPISSDLKPAIKLIPMVCLAQEVQLCLAKLPLNFNCGLAEVEFSFPEKKSNG